MEVPAMERIYAKLTPDQVATIKRLAQVERRHPSDQIAVMLERHLAEQAKDQEVAVQ
jgi:hypothetical protein